MKLTKRDFLKTGAASLAAIPLGNMALAATSYTSSPKHNLATITQDVKPISIEERQQRIDKAQKLMKQHQLAAMVLEPGPAMDYFTGIQWWRSERLTAVIIPAEGDIAVVCPFFEEPSIRESLKVGDDVRVWQEHESPFALIKQILTDRKITKGQIGFEQSVRYFVLQGLMSLLSTMSHSSADPVTLGCRMYKSVHELQLMHKANEVTLRAYEHVWQQLAEGMSQQEVKQLMHTAQSDLGGSDIWTMALFNQASAYPHGSKQHQVIKNGSIVLMDCGCAVQGYQSDISRTFVFGEPSAKQRKIWATVRQGQQVAFEKAQIGTAAGKVDDAVRAYYQSQGLGPDYTLPGLSHRTGHGIGMQGHEPVNFVHGEQQKLAAGMCFSNEPGVYIPGEFGVRLEDCIYMTDKGPQWFTVPPDSIESPIGKMGPVPV
ncbi:M24 family metallopeptidase [Neptunicella sp. SCSIO 80796]|uniref:M24 family metallopeptidase n=1 Tax=Neptunicella plasticusilytica TaxID=3117012 RepID=UPI003A4E26A0